MTLRERFRDWLMKGYAFPVPTVASPVTGTVMIAQMKDTVLALFEKMVVPRIGDLVGRTLEGLIAARLRDLLVRSHDEWTRELTAALLRHVNSEKEKENAKTHASS